MQYIPVPLERLLPPQNDFIQHFLEAHVSLNEKDILCISSKVASIHDGSCVAIDHADKAHLMKDVSPHLFGEDTPVPMGFVHHAFFPFAGIDESNGNGYYILLPRDPFALARSFWEQLRAHFGLKELGVIICDSSFLPFRAGTTGVSLGFFGFEPVIDYRGQADLFGRPLEYTQLNIPDSLSSGANLLMGEGAESTPTVIVRDYPHVRFSELDQQDAFLMPPADDAWRSVIPLPESLH